MIMRVDRGTVMFLVGQLFFVACTFLFSAVSAHYLGPYDMGVWNFINLIAEYGMIATLGIINGMGREVPYLTGQGDLIATNSVILTTFKFLISVCFSLVVIALLWHFFDLFNAYTVVFGIALLVSRIVFACSYMLIRSLQDYFLLGQQLLTVAFIQIAGLLFIWHFKNIPSVLAGTVISLLCGALLCGRLLKAAGSAAYTSRIFIRLARVGMPIFLVGMIYTLFLSTDRLLIANFLGMTKLGLYTPAVLAVGVTSLVPNIVGNIMYPRMAELYGKTELLSPLIPIMRNMIIINLAATFVLSGLFYSVFNYVVIPYFLKDYAASVPSMLIILIATIISPIGLSLGDLFNVVGCFRAYLTNIIISVIVNLVVGGVLLYTTTLELIGVSIGTLCAFIIFSLLQYLTYQRLLRDRE